MDREPRCRERGYRPTVQAAPMLPNEARRQQTGARTRAPVDTRSRSRRRGPNKRRERPLERREYRLADQPPVPRSGELRCRRPVRTRSLPAPGFNSREGSADTATERQTRRKARRIKSRNAITGGWGKRPCKTNAARRAGVWNSWALPPLWCGSGGLQTAQSCPIMRTFTRRSQKDRTGWDRS